MPEWQDLSRFRLPADFRGRSAPVVLLWQLTQATLFACSPQFAHGWRRWLLRLFGARIGRKVVIRQSARITYPWKVEIGDYSWIGDHAELYSLGPIRIGESSVISQRAYLCAGTHDYRSADFTILSPPIQVGDRVWIATDVFVAPGVSIGDGAVIGARSSVFHDIAAGEIAFGSPARVQGTR